MKLKNKNLILTIAFVFFILLVLFFLPVKITFHIKAPVKIISEKEWILRKGTDGSLVASLHDHRNGLVENYIAAQVERGDAVDFRLHPSFATAHSVETGDTIGVVHSNEIARQLTQLEGSLIAAKATLQSYLSGEKQPVIEGARRQVSLNLEKAELQNKILERQKALLEQDLISREEYEIHESTARIYELEAALAEAQLHAVATGAKPADIELIRAQIHALESEIAVLKNRLQKLTLLSPISGRIYRVFSPDTLFIIGDTTLMGVIPIKAQYRHEISPGSVVRVNGSEKLTGRLIRIENRMQQLNGSQVFLAIAVFEDASPRVPVNIIVPCEIAGGQYSVYQYIWRFINHILFQ